MKNLDEGAMTHAVHAATPEDIDSIAWQFLRSPFTRRDYWDWPLDRRVDTYLAQQDRGDILRDDRAYRVMLERVMANISRARRDGVLGPTHL